MGTDQGWSWYRSRDICQHGYRSEISLATDWGPDTDQGLTYMLLLINLSRLSLAERERASFVASIYLLFMVSVTFLLTCVYIILVRSGLLSGNLLGNNCSLG